MGGYYDQCNRISGDGCGTLDRFAGMCRSPESSEQHFRLEKEFRALADDEERVHGARAPQDASDPQIVK
jgi:hypothetical protein